MKKTAFFLSIWFIFLSMNIFAQITTPSVISPSGGFFSNNQGMLSTTVGEMTMIQTFTNGNNILTQGFHQDWDFIPLSVYELNGNDFNIEVYPNPSDGIFKVALNSDKSFEVELTVYDLLGVITYKVKFLQSSGLEEHTLNLQQLPNGIYILELSSIDLAANNPTRIIKKIDIVH